MKNNIRLAGVVTARTPIMHVDGTSADKTYSIKTSVQTTDQDGNINVAEVPYVQGSSFRGVMRDIMAGVIARKIEEKGELLDLNTAMRLFSGGQMKQDSVISLKERREILENCPDLKLFGGIARSMFPSTIRFGSLYPILEETLAAGMVPACLENHKQLRTIMRNEKPVDILNAWVIQRRHDEILDGDNNAVRFLSPEAMSDAEEYIRHGMEVQDEKKKARKKGEKSESKKSIQKHFATIQVIPAGTKLFSEIHLVESDEVATGLALVTLAEFLKRPYICSASRAGYGNVSFNYDLTMENGEVIKDFISTSKDGSHTVRLDLWGQEFVDAFDNWVYDASAKSLKVA